MGVAGDTFINEMMKQSGLKNVLTGFVPQNFTGDESLRYPMFSLEELVQLNPDVVLLSSEPFPFKAKHMAEIRQVLPNAEIRLVDGEMFSWYGSPEYFSNLVQSLDGVRVQ
jgi:ABC-type Fe3+-citrate transport system substrate-binding protein